MTKNEKETTRFRADLKRVLDYSWQEEEHHYETCLANKENVRKHVFVAMRNLMRHADRVVLP